MYFERWLWNCRDKQIPRVSHIPLKSLIGQIRAGGNTTILTLPSFQIVMKFGTAFW